MPSIHTISLSIVLSMKFGSSLSISSNLTQGVHKDVVPWTLPTLPVQPAPPASSSLHPSSTRANNLPAIASSALHPAFTAPYLTLAQYWLDA